MITKTFTVDGQRYYVRAKTEELAISKMAIKKAELEKGIVPLNGNMLVKEWANKSVTIYKTDCKDVTLSSFVDVMDRCVLQYIGNLRLKDVKPVHCMEIMNRQIGNSKSQIAHVFQALRFIFTTAKDNNLIYDDPTKAIKKPKGYVHSRREITEYEKEHLLKCCEKNERFLIFRTMLETGMRPSEAREVRGFDVQKINNVSVLHIRGTKTERADRYVPLPDELYDILIEKDPFKCLFTNTYGDQLTKNSFSRLWHLLIREMNISMGCRVYRNQVVPPFRVADDFVPYNLRHTYACNLMKNDISIPKAILLMGHTTADLYLGIYTHKSQDIVEEASELLYKKVQQ